MRTFQDEKNILLESFINRYQKNVDSIEFIISSECNQACEYCYLYKHGHKMYSKESNDKHNVLHNLKLLLDYFYTNGFKVNTFELFSGEFFQLSYWEDVFTILYEHPITDNKDFEKRRFIGIPSNFSFLLDEEKTEKIEKWIDIFNNEKNIVLFLSCSVDGPEDLESLERPIKNNSKIKQKDFYDKMFKFLKKHKYIPHPMITKNFVLNYKENYDFWIDNIMKYNCAFEKNGSKVYNIPMFLEVRDPEQWDSPEVLEKYREFLLYMAEKDLKSYHNNNLEEFAMHVIDDFSDDMKNLGLYNKIQPYPIGLPTFSTKIPCSIQNGMVCRVGDLAIVPCHRTCYPNMLYGHFTTNEDNTKITGVNGDKIGLAYKIQTCNPSRSFLKCSECSIKSICIKGCLGSQYENTGELFGSQENVCNMFKTKYRTIHEICEKYGIYEIANNNILIPDERRRYIEYARQQMSQL